MATIKDIARRAGVSVTTVSKVINNYPDIGTDTREKVLKVIDEFNYRPNANARSLTMDKSYSIGIFFKDHQNSGLRHPFFRDIIYGLEQEFCKFGYDLILFSSKWGDKFKYIEKCRHRRVDGAVLMGMPRSDGDLEGLIDSGIPAVFIDLDLEGDYATYVMSDNVEGARQAVDYLYRLGHRKIAMITGESMTRPAQDRLKGYRASLEEHELTYQPEWVVEGEFSEEGGFTSMKKLIDLSSRPTAVFCQGDQIAIGALRAIKDSKFSVPGDFSVIGFDDIEISRYIDPKLTTVHQNKYRMGRIAAEQLISIINNPEQDYPPVILPTELIERNSCATPEPDDR